MIRWRYVKLSTGINHLTIDECVDFIKAYKSYDEYYKKQSQKCLSYEECLNELEFGTK